MSEPLDITVQIALDCADPHQQADFWAEALGYTADRDEAFVQRMLDAGHATEDDVTRYLGMLVWKTGDAISDPSGRGPRWFFQQVPEHKAGKNRMHVDLQVGEARRSAEVERLLGLGATKLYDGQLGPQQWVTMADPEGNEFCVS